ncbi:hypothetical protein B7463_g1731, partial [Scytalidium lignicola]
MSSSDLIDYSPHQPEAVAPLPNASNVILIDNFDSFSWNVYQYLVLEGATVTVYRNNAITVENIVALKPTQLVISPGPGHPKTDSGISRDAIKQFAGKIPILGICMGQECILDLYGGEVSYAGEILHGKTSPLRHDSKGVYANIPQNLPVTRYHSLAGTYPTLPECLEVSAWAESSVAGAEGVILGVRHKENVLEGVQFHPESILTAEGRLMLKNFLNMRGGTWAENDKLQTEASVQANQTVNSSNGPKKENILNKIFAHRKAVVASQKEIPSQRPYDLQAMYDLDIAPPLVSFVDRLRKSPFPLSLMAEIKRASPSKGIISLAACAPAQARTYALAGASVISVLTEPEWFKGSIDDLRAVRQVLEGMPNRPAVLRKEFIFEEYQILEARLAGADTVLLIVKMLDKTTLTRLYHYSQSLGMEPLVEVNTAEEMAIAVELGSKVIGVNNRNLTSFDVDLDTTSRLLHQVPKGTIVCALSGISGPKDVEAYQKNGVGAVLVGEALMRATDTAKFIRELLSGAEEPITQVDRSVLVKICGTRTAEVATEAIKAGADLIGMILVPGRSRSVSREAAFAISEAVHGGHRSQKISSIHAISALQASDFFTASTSFLDTARPLLVGVFQNQPLKDILKLQKDYNLDIVQLHGNEPLEWARIIPVPVIKSFKPGQSGLGKRGYHSIALLDSGTGGTGQKLDMAEVKDALSKDQGLQVLLAGGLNPENVAEALKSAGDLSERIIGVDVSSGVEENGHQSIEKIKAFIEAAKNY